MEKSGFEPLNLAPAAVLPSVVFIANDLICAAKCVRVCTESLEVHMTQFPALLVLVFSVSYKEREVFSLFKHAASLNKLIHGSPLYTSQN